MSPSGRLVNFTLGNGLVTERRLDLLDRITGLSTGPAGRVQNVSFQYDALGNLTARTDSNQPLDESFSYDALNRLTAAFTSGLPSQSFAYDAIGNLVYKSDVGTYRYGVQPHAVIETQASPAHTPLAYTYDANGNLVSGAGRTITHTSYNLPARIAANGGTTVLEFSYDADHQRFRELRPGGETLYLNPRIDTGLHYEQERRGTLTEHKHYLYAGAEVIGVYIRRSDGIDSTRYFHSDPLGSITAITHETGTVVERLSYDAFGKRRFPTGVDDPGNTLAGHTTHHGFTAHEHLDEVGLIHMNGRVYDPRLGRFLEADPDIQFPFSTQGLNRYSYVDNNPLSRIDPSGYGWLSKTWKKVWRGVKKAARNPVVRAVAAIAVAWYIGPAVTNYLTDVAWNIATATAQPISFAQINTLTYAANAVGGAAGGFASSLVASGGDLQAGLNGAISGGLFGGVNGYFDNQWSLGRVATNGVTGGVAAELTGGDFNKGFVSSFTTSALTYASFTMRDVMIEQSRLDSRNASGVGVGFMGDGFKLGGGRWVEGLSADRQLPSPLGGLQGGQGMLFGRPYSPGSWADYLVEAYAGPHDYLNSGRWYDNASGNAFNLTGFARAAGEALNVSNVVVATPFVAASVIPTYAYSPTLKF
jgi:RHS repeat-associated protein